MPRIFPTTVRRTTVVGGGGEGPPTGTWAEDTQVGDDVAAGVDLTDDLDVVDQVVAGVDLADEVTVTDELVAAGLAVDEGVEVNDVPAVATSLADDVQVDDAYAATASLVEGVEVGDGWSSTLTGSWAEDAVVGDDLTTWANLAEDVTVADDPRAGTALTEEWTAADDLAVKALLTEDANVNDLTMVLLYLVSGDRSGTPDADPMCDGWIDQAAPTVNHGAEATMLVRGKSTLANDERRVGIEVDLTWAGDWTFIETGFQLGILVSHTTIGLTANLDWVAFTATTRPFVESTWNWNTALPALTQIANGAIVVPAGAATAQGLTIAPAQAATLPGKWLFIRFTAVTATAPPTFTINTRENAASPPRWNATRIQRGT